MDSDKRMPKALEWVGCSRQDLIAFPSQVRKSIGHALYLAQIGEKAPAAKPLRGFAGAGVLEIVDAFEGNAYRAVYTVKFNEAVFVLHAFQKKSKRGGATPQAEMHLIRQRLKAAEDHYKQRYGTRS